MPVPDYQTLMLPVLKLIAGGATNVSECLPAIQAQFQISDDEAQEMLPSGRMTYLQNRAHWARTYLSKAGLLTSPKHNYHEVTDLGRSVLAENPAQIDNTYLARFEDFADWRDHASGPETPPASQSASSTPEDSQTPEDAMDSANRIIQSALRDELLGNLLSLTPQRFERVILDLLSAMGFGGGRLENTHMTQASGDGGIDGIIHEDALGLDAVYIQAKRYAPDNKISRPDIQRFVGSLNGEGATKGVFVTTSDFSREARDYISRVPQRIVLINGARFADLMIEHGVGVRVRRTYAIQSVDEDYFG